MQILKYVLYALVAIDSIILCTLVLLQQGKSNGLSGLSGQVSSDNYWSKHRGSSAEGTLEKGTRILAVLLFLLIALLNTTLFH